MTDIMMNLFEIVKRFVMDCFLLTHNALFYIFDSSRSKFLSITGGGS